MAIMVNDETLPADGTIFTYQDHQYVVGQTVDAWGIMNLPEGTTVWDGNARLNRIWTKIEGGWTSNGSHPAPIAENFNRLRSFPHQGPPTGFAEFRAQFAEAVRTVASRYSDTHRALADEILAGLGVDEPIIGSPVFYRTPGKAGQIAVFGEPDAERFTIFRHDGTTWVKAHGWYDSMQDAGQCRLTSGGMEIDDDDVEIARFKDAVWAAGSKAKQEHQWCSAYDRVLADFGIVDLAPRPDFSQWGTLVKGVEARANMAAGSVLAGDRGDWGIFAKEGGEWVRKAGTRPLAAGTMRLLHDGAAGPLRIRNAKPALEAFLPDAAWDGNTLVGWRKPLVV